jgi:hypothetical protein
MGCLYLMQAARAPNPAVAQEKANQGIQLLIEQTRTQGDESSYPYHAYLTHVSRWYEVAGTLISQNEWEALRRISTEAKKTFPRDDMIHSAALLVERRYLQRVVVDKPEEPV